MAKPKLKHKEKDIFLNDELWKSLVKIQGPYDHRIQKKLREHGFPRLKRGDYSEVIFLIFGQLYFESGICKWYSFKKPDKAYLLDVNTDLLKFYLSYLNVFYRKEKRIRKEVKRFEKFFSKIDGYSMKKISGLMQETATKLDKDVHKMVALAFAFSRKVVKLDYLEIVKHYKQKMEPKVSSA